MGSTLTNINLNLLDAHVGAAVGCCRCSLHNVKAHLSNLAVQHSSRAGLQLEGGVVAVGVTVQAGEGGSWSNNWRQWGLCRNTDIHQTHCHAAVVVQW